MTEFFVPTSASELAEWVPKQTRIDVPLWPEETVGLSFSGLRDGFEHAPDDGFVVVPAGWTWDEFSGALAEKRQWLPYAHALPEDVEASPLSRLVLLGLPHFLEASYGTWRDWLLGATWATAEGTLVTSGSRVVKSVAGYDAHKLLIGSRGTLGLPTTFVFRTYPVKDPIALSPLPKMPTSVARCLASDFERLQALEDLIGADHETATGWFDGPPPEMQRFRGGWSYDLRHPAVPASTFELQRRTKAVLDPTSKLAPSVFTNLQ